MNPIYDNTLLMYQKLKDIGFIDQNGEVVIIERDETYQL